MPTRSAILWMCLAAALAACASPAAPALDAGAAAAADVALADALSSHSFTCNQVIGLSVTGEWYAAGFETFVDDSRWQAVTLTHAYVDLWTDPTNTVWATAPVSPCAANAADPDRVLFTGCNWDYTTAAQWTTAFAAVVENIKAKYPKLKRIELLTMLRAPGNQSCPTAVNAETVVQPFIDEAVATTVAAYPGLVVAAPQFEAPNCDVFILGGPHFTADGQAAIAKLYGDYYANQP